MQELVRQLMVFYPQVYFACHTRHVRDARRNVTLSSHQASVLDHLDEIEPTSMGTLADHMGVTASTMSITVDRLARQGYVTRKRSLNDGRTVHLRLTKAGVRVKAEKSVLDPMRVRRVLEQLTVQEREKAVAGLGLLAQAAHRAMRSAKSGLTKRSHG